jgi:hypothetical protein
MKSNSIKQALGGVGRIAIFGSAACSQAATKIPAGPPEPQSLPEVGTMVLFGIGLLGVAAIIRWRIRA